MRNKERWMELCEQAANEQDPQKLLDLVLEIDAALAEKEARLEDAAATAANLNGTAYTSER
jgi:hypothetical protein